MICPNCQGNVSDKKKKCERCGTDLTTYKSIMKAANLYYNTGLAKAKVRDLSGAVIALKNGLQLNKAHTDGRNLLGLVYFEMGETVSALSEWVISKHFQPEDNDADHYINEVQSNPTKLDAFNQAIKRYNTALTYAKQGSGDLAIIQLKKVITLNPHFIRAYQLLALLYMKSGENDKALRYLHRASKIDVSNTLTLKYIKELEPKGGTIKEGEGKSASELKGPNSIMPLSSYKEDKPNIMAFVNLVIGVIIGIAVMSILVIPSIKNKQVVDENKKHVDYSASLAEIEAKEATITSLKEDNKKLEDEVKTLQEQLDSIVIPEENTTLYDTLFQASQLYMEELAKSQSSRDYSVLVEKLTSIDEKEYKTEAATALLAQIRGEVYPKVAKKYYDSGRAKYNQGDYEKALSELLTSYQLNPDDENTIYFLARTYHRIEDFENAIIYYSIITKDYSDTSRYADAQRFLDQLTQ